MELLHHGVDQSVIALWLGHESVETTKIYIHADMRLKEKALASVAAPETRPGRFRPDDEILDWLETPCLCRKDGKSVVSGMSVSVRVNLVGRSILEKKK